MYVKVFVKSNNEFENLKLFSKHYWLWNIFKKNLSNHKEEITTSVSMWIYVCNNHATTELNTKSVDFAYLPNAVLSSLPL